MKIAPGRYEVFGPGDELWGWVDLKWPRPSVHSELFSATISGYLEATSAFVEPAKIFTEWSRAAELGDEPAAELFDRVSSMHITLVSIDGRNRHRVCQVFVSDDNLFTCSQEI